MENIYDKIQESANFIESKSEVKPSIYVKLQIHLFQRRPDADEDTEGRRYGGLRVRRKRKNQEGRQGR